jgi:hypothetical protein
MIGGHVGLLEKSFQPSAIGCQPEKGYKLKLATEGTEITEFLKPKKYRDKRQVSKAIRLRRTKVEKRNFLYNPVISKCSGPRLSPG